MMTTNHDASAALPSEPAPIAMTRREPIDPAERQQRQAAMDGARANIHLEGFQPSAEAEERARRYIAGEIDMAELVKLP